ncbi:MAG: hypothetical protein AAF318_05945 [Pseudomonadota bacterium]
MLEIVTLMLLGWFGFRTIGTFAFADTLSKYDERPCWAFLISWDTTQSAPGGSYGQDFGGGDGGGGGGE